MRKSKLNIFISIAVILLIGIGYYYYRIKHNVVMCGNSTLFLDEAKMTLLSQQTLPCVHIKQYYICSFNNQKNGMVFVYDDSTTTLYPALNLQAIPDKMWNSLCIQKNGMVVNNIPGYLLCIFNKPSVCESNR